MCASTVRTRRRGTITLRRLLPAVRLFASPTPQLDVAVFRRDSFGSARPARRRAFAPAADPLRFLSEAGRAYPTAVTSDAPCRRMVPRRGFHPSTPLVLTCPRARWTDGLADQPPGQGRSSRTPVRARGPHNPERLQLARLLLVGEGGRGCITIRHTSHGQSTSFTTLLGTRLVRAMGPVEPPPYVTFGAETPLAPQGWCLSPTSATDLLSWALRGCLALKLEGLRPSDHRDRLDPPARVAHARARAALSTATLASHCWHHQPWVAARFDAVQASCGPTYRLLGDSESNHDPFRYSPPPRAR